MNNIQELIERLKKIANPVKGIDAVTSPKDRQAIKETITALESMQAPLPDDVAGHIGMLRDNAKIMAGKYDIEQEVIAAADMLERLAYENQCHILARKQDKQRIEKQDKTMLAYESRIKRLDAALAELQNHVWADIGDQRFFNRVYEKARAGE
jgi:hypothetical protein